VVNLLAWKESDGDAHTQENAAQNAQDDPDEPGNDMEHDGQLSESSSSSTIPASVVSELVCDEAFQIPLSPTSPASDCELVFD
jgi:hypothetical protein